MIQPQAKDLVPSAFGYGKQIGMYKGFPIYDVLTDNHGVVREFKGVVTKITTTAPGAIITAPGLLYEPVQASA